ncbi:MAG TPA: 16S rRNA (adenine(1518)-N(6)/adenine(1519)-N(6))-dimethyltransferase RsmA [Bryobacteraceae bacterium]|nr:16S rRNA (adenine(1518)-N(6)/adenine(1519)-N(6))-dimethyltransferase RsmA [Bryobacteraceae bacterium]
MPRKLGQHFLNDQAQLRRIADNVCGEGTPRVIEIGPGKGALTRYLLERTAELHAIEIDEELCASLERKFAGHGGFHLHCGDVLATDLGQWGPAALAGNLPYYITSPIITRFLHLGMDFPCAVFLMQEEVAERIQAAPGSRDYGFLSVQTQLLCTVRIVSRVPPSAFVPPPKVKSAVVQFDRQRMMDEDVKRIIQFAGRCFAHKRKTLRNNLKPYYPSQALNAVAEAGLRAEQLSINELVDLEKRLRTFPVPAI